MVIGQILSLEQVLKEGVVVLSSENLQMACTEGGMVLPFGGLLRECNIVQPFEGIELWGAGL